MKTIITEEEYELELNNNKVNSLNFVSLSIWKAGECLGELDLSIGELMGAIIGFDARRSRMSDFDKECD